MAGTGTIASLFFFAGFFAASAALSPHIALTIVDPLRSAVPQIEFIEHLDHLVLAASGSTVDEKLERAQGYLKLPDGRAMTGQSHDYKRHGTTTLFAALDLASGKILGKHYKRRRRVEFLNFMNHVVAAHPAREIHVVLDNLSTHKPKRDMWLKRHKNVHFHYTPTHSSWLNQIEIWFSILAGKSLDGASFQSVPELIAHIDAFIASYNETARPFVWTKSEVHQKRLKPCFADQ